MIALKELWASGTTAYGSPALVSALEYTAGNRAEIAATDSIHALYAGPNDLSLSLGLGRIPHRESARLREAIAAVVGAARAVRERSTGGTAP